MAAYTTLSLSTLRITESSMPSSNYPMATFSLCNSEQLLDFHDLLGRAKTPDGASCITISYR